MSCMQHTFLLLLSLTAARTCACILPVHAYQACIGASVYAQAMIPNDTLMSTSDVPKSVRQKVHDRLCGMIRNRPATGKPCFKGGTRIRLPATHVAGYRDRTGDAPAILSDKPEQEYGQSAMEVINSDMSNNNRLHIRNKYASRTRQFIVHTRDSTPRLRRPEVPLVLLG